MSNDLTNKGVVFLSNVRLSFPNIAEPQRNKKEDGTERVSYSAVFLMTPDNPGWAQFHAVVQQMAAEKWKEHAQAVLNFVQQDRKLRCYSQGTEHIDNKTFRPRAGYEGMVVITAGSSKMPQMIDGNGQGIDPANTMACVALARSMYPGCRVNAAVRPWLQENKHGRGVRCDLIAMQFAGDDAPFGEAVTDASSLFGATAAAPAMPAGAPWGQPQMPGAPFPPAGVPAGLPPFLTGQ